MHCNTVQYNTMQNNGKKGKSNGMKVIRRQCNSIQEIMGWYLGTATNGTVVCDDGKFEFEVV